MIRYDRQPTCLLFWEVGNATSLFRGNNWWYTINEDERIEEAFEHSFNFCTKAALVAGLASSGHRLFACCWARLCRALLMDTVKAEGLISGLSAAMIMNPRTLTRYNWLSTLTSIYYAMQRPQREWKIWDLRVRDDGIYSPIYKRNIENQSGGKLVWCIILWQTCWLVWVTVRDPTGDFPGKLKQNGLDEELHR